MKSKIFSFAILMLTLGFVSCSSDDDSQAVEQVTPTATAGFKWKENGSAEITADAAYFETAYKTIKASKGTPGTTGYQFVEINLSGTSPATYTVGTGNAVSTLAGYVASAGNVVVSSNASGKMSGTVTSTGSGSGVTSFDATFTDIEVR